MERSHRALVGHPELVQALGSLEGIVEADLQQILVLAPQKTHKISSHRSEQQSAHLPADVQTQHACKTPLPRQQRSETLSPSFHQCWSIQIGQKFRIGI